MNGLRRRQVLAVPLALLPAQAALAQPAPPAATPEPAEVSTEVPAARLRGSGRLRLFGLLIYDARLWAGSASVGQAWTDTPFALELVYGRSISRQRIVESSLAEMRRQGEIVPEQARGWLQQLQAMVPDVREGDRITGVNRPGQTMRLYFNGSLRGEVADAEFARLFFGIWLSPQTSEPALRSALLGQLP